MFEISASYGGAYTLVADACAEAPDVAECKFYFILRYKSLLRSAALPAVYPPPRQRKTSASPALDLRSNRINDGGAAKLAMSKVVSISAKRAYELYHCEGLVGDRLGFAVKSLDELKALSTEQLRHINPIGEGRMLRWLLDHHDELQQPVPEAEAIAMLDAVRRVVRAQHSQRSGRRRDCERLPGVPLCRCCWHVEFVGGGRRRGRPGHDADLLVWHREETNSWGDDRHHDNVLRPLTRALEDEVTETRAPRGGQRSFFDAESWGLGPNSPSTRVEALGG